MTNCRICGYPVEDDTEGAESKCDTCRGVPDEDHDDSPRERPQRLEHCSHGVSPVSACFRCGQEAW